MSQLLGLATQEGQVPVVPLRAKTLGRADTAAAAMKRNEKIVAFMVNLLWLKNNLFVVGTGLFPLQ